MQFEKGKPVQLISGGPVMTVESVDGATGRVCCIWFDNDRNLLQEMFDPATLRMWRDPHFEPEDTEYDPLGSYR